MSCGIVRFCLDSGNDASASKPFLTLSSSSNEGFLSGTDDVIHFFLTSLCTKFQILSKVTLCFINTSNRCLPHPWQNRTQDQFQRV